MRTRLVLSYDRAGLSVSQGCARRCVFVRHIPPVSLLLLVVFFFVKEQEGTPCVVYTRAITIGQRGTQAEISHPWILSSGLVYAHTRARASISFISAGRAGKTG